MPRLPIIDPLAIPVIGTDAHLPAVGPERLTPEALRLRFQVPTQAAGSAWYAELPSDAHVLRDRPPAAASVLVPLVMRGDALHVLLTRRTEHLRDHAGQISFPGGRAEAHDADAVETALRETEEEVGLPRSFIEVIGRLPIYRTVTAFEISPIVALVRPDFSLTLDAFEVAEAFEVPLPFLMTPAHHQRHLFTLDDGEQRQFLSMPWTAQDAIGITRQYFIWGATAAMLRNLYGFLAS